MPRFLNPGKPAQDPRKPAKRTIFVSNGRDFGWEAAELLRRRDTRACCPRNLCGADTRVCRARKQLESGANRRRLKNIRFHGPQPKSCDLRIAILKNNPTFRTLYPNKAFDDRWSARPVLLAIDGVARQLVCEQADAGCFAESENTAAIEKMAGNLVAAWPNASPNMANSANSAESVRS